MKSTALRKLAKGQPCQIRIPNYCCHNPETTVLCHDNLAGLGGMGMKSPDLCAAWGCHMCHKVIDGQINTIYTPDKIKLMFYEGMSRTLAELTKLDIVK